jgi:hypothetical protein
MGQIALHQWSQFANLNPNPFRVLLNGDDDSRQFRRQARSRWSKDSCEKVVFFLVNLFHTRVAKIHQE